MFNALFNDLVNGAADIRERAEGAAFLKVAKDLYGFKSIAYLSVNIPSVPRGKHYMHCMYSDRSVRHCVGRNPVSIDSAVRLELTSSHPLDWQSSANHGARAGNGFASADETGAPATFPLRTFHGETAVFGIIPDLQPSEPMKQVKGAVRDFQILANYFHSHVLRMNGHNADEEMLVSARELDCLKWTAAGKTAWEASVILGISERTVRFHLNAAREKMQCATTTQAVAKAVAQNLIAP